MRPLPVFVSTSLVSLTLVSSASAATLIDFKPHPVSPLVPEFVFSGDPVPSFSAGPGSTGNADGTLAPSVQAPGGLIVETPFTLPGIPGSFVNVVTGGTTFYDSTLVLAGLSASAPASTSGSLLIQPLGAGSFSVLSTDPDGGGPLTPTLLLSGTIDASSFIVGTGDAASEFNSFGVTYTGGVIHAELLEFGVPTSGHSMSISMTDVSPNLSIGTRAGVLSDFSANGTGLFNFVPEPASLAVLAMGGMLAMRRQRR